MSLLATIALVLVIGVLILMILGTMAVGIVVVGYFSYHFVAVMWENFENR